MVPSPTERWLLAYDLRFSDHDHASKLFEVINATVFDYADVPAAHTAPEQRGSESFNPIGQSLRLGVFTGVGPNDERHDSRR